MQIQFRVGLFSGDPNLRSVRERIERQKIRDQKIAYFEEQKEKLKENDSLELSEIAKKLSMFHQYEDAIAAAKQEYNNEQKKHVMDEAEEFAARRAEKKEEEEEWIEESAERAPEELAENEAGSLKKG